MKKRQYLPLMAKTNLSVDISRLQKEFLEMGYDDWSLYNGLKSECASENGRIVRRVLLEYFLNEQELEERKDEAVTEGGEAYKMLCLTDYDGPASENLAVDNPHITSKKLEKISNPNHPMYIPEADEKLYDKRNEYCKGYINEVLDMIEENIGHVTRTRYAVLMPGEEIKPHMDINTDKAIRIHIPLFTNEDTVVGVKGKKTSIEKNLPADGSVWFLNQGFSHWVKNNGDTPRVHLVCSVVGQGCIEEGETWYDTSESFRAA